MHIITLTTDFGTADGFVGAMKGVILSIAPAAQIVDLTHGIPPQDIIAGAMALEVAAPFFPTGTIHVAVVDPGVGSARRAICIQAGDQWFIGPDNGLFELATAGKIQRVYRLSNPDYFLKPLSSTFHGRDIFSPVAAHLARGERIEKMGELYSGELVSANLPVPVATGDALEIHVVHADRFGNLMTDLTLSRYESWNPSWRRISIEGGTLNLSDIKRTYSDVAPCEPLAYFSSSGRLELAIRGGDARTALSLPTGSTLRLKLRA